MIHGFAQFLLTLGGLRLFFKATIPPMLCNTARLDLGSRWSMPTFVFFHRRCLPTSSTIEFLSVIPTGQSLFIYFQKKKKKSPTGQYPFFFFVEKKKPTGRFLQTKTSKTLSSKVKSPPMPCLDHQISILFTPWTSFFEISYCE